MTAIAHIAAKSVNHARLVEMTEKQPTSVLLGALAAIDAKPINEQDSADTLTALVMDLVVTERHGLDDAIDQIFDTGVDFGGRAELLMLALAVTNQEITA